MLKKCLIFIVFFLCIANFSFADTPDIYIKDVQKKEDSEYVTMKVYMNNVKSNLDSLSLDLTFDAKKLEYVSSKPGINMKTTVQIAEFLNGDNTLCINMDTPSGLKKDGMYYEVTFKVLDLNVAKVPVNLSVREAKNLSGEPVRVNTTAGTVYVSEKGTSTEPSIDPFEDTEIEDQPKLPDIVKPNIDPELEPDEKLEFESKDPEKIEILEDGTIKIKQDGISIVDVLVDKEVIGAVKVKTEERKSNICFFRWNRIR